MGLLRNLISVIILLALVWSSLILVSYILAVTLFPALEQGSGNLVISILRVFLGLAVFAIWAISWYLLTRIWLYKILLRRG